MPLLEAQRASTSETATTMPRERSPPPSTARSTKVDTASSRVKPDPSVAQAMPPQSAPLPPPKPPAVFTSKEALARSSVLMDQIPAVVEQMKFHKKQARRLAESASFVFDAIDSSIPKPPPEDTGGFISDGLEKLIRCTESLIMTYLAHCSLECYIESRSACVILVPGTLSLA